MEADLSSGTVLGSYRVIQKLDNTSTFLAINTSTKKEVKIQQLNKGSFRYTLEKGEIEVISRANNKNIISPIEVLEDSTNTYIVQEHHKGINMESYVNNSKLKESKVKEIIQDLVNAYQTLYSNSILHYNINPKSVFVIGKEKKVIKLGNIGIISKNIDKLYIAPEILNENTEYNCLCDVWAIGAVIYYMLHGCAPYEINELKRGKCFIRPNVTKNCYDFLYSCLQHDPEKRMTFESMRQHPFLTEIEAHEASQKTTTEDYYEFSSKFSKLPKSKSKTMKFIKGIIQNKE